MSDAHSTSDAADARTGLVSARLQRRRLFKQAAMGAVATAAFGGGSLLTGAAEAQTAPSPSTLTDADILNFALNLEYLEAEFYNRAAFGTGLSDADISGKGKLGPVLGGSQVAFSTALSAQYAAEVATDELRHVRFLRSALGSKAVARPTIDLATSFTTAAVGAGVISAGQTFNPFADEASFLIAAFIFEDVGVTAYNGAATFIKNKGYLQAAAGILATEAYHAGSIRTMLLAYGLTDAANKISAFRAAASAAVGGPGAGDDQGVTVNGQANVVSGDSNSIAFARTPQEVLNIVYLGGASGGYGFFPDLLNGALR